MPQNQEVRLPAIVGDRLLEIPDYQRPYAWQHKQLADLWEDIDLLGQSGTHYAGTLVLRDIPRPDGSAETSMDDDGTTLRHCEVVDGQQRLTTCLLLLDRIRRRLEGLEADGLEDAGKVARGISRRYGMVSIDNAPVPRLRLGSELNTYWVSVVLTGEEWVGAPLIGGQRRLREALEFFDIRLDGLSEGVSPSQQLDRLRELQRRITDGLGFLVYEVHSVAEVGDIFETLNDRGRGLSDLEKTKNYLLYLARLIPDARGDQLADRVNSAWGDIFSNLAEEAADSEDQLLRAHWLATQDPARRNWKGIASIKHRFDRSNYVSSETRIVPSTRPHRDQAEAWDDLYGDVDAYVESLRRCSFFFREMFDDNAPFEAFGSERDKVRLRSAALARSGVVAVYRPLLFAARLTEPSNGGLYAELVDLCERYTARVFVIEQRRTDAGEARLLTLANELYSGATPSEGIVAEVRALLWRYAPDHRVRTTLESTDENWYVRRGHKYFLYEYERSLLDPREELPPLSNFTDSTKEQRTTEHILPQQPRADAACWWDHFSPEDHARLHHALGNLALTYDNSAYSNKCFEDKRGEALRPGEAPSACYAQGKLHQERELAAYDEWTPEVITARQREFAEWALERWAVAPPDPEAAAVGNTVLEGDEGEAPESRLEVEEGGLL